MGKAEKQVHELFETFKKLHSNNTEQFDPTLDNIRRWAWANNEANIRNTTEQLPFDMPDNRRAKRLAQSRAVGSFVRLSGIAKEKFLFLASLFPGRKVYATGSRITGEYIDEDSPGAVVRMRADLMKKETRASDYDVTLDFTKDDDVDALRKLLPTWGDLVVKPLPDEPKIEIPMWDFLRLPNNLHDDIVDLVDAKQWGKLMSIHNEFQLSDTLFCCDSKPAERWFTWAIENKIIQRSKPKIDNDETQTTDK